MKYRFGILGEGSGSIEGLTFSHNRYGPYVRAKVTGVNPNSARQQAVRSVWQALSNAWNSELSEAERELWRVYADSITVKDSLGRDITLTGYSMFMRTNTVALGGAVAQVNSGPTIFTLAQADETMVGTVDEAGQEISVAFDDTRAWAGEDEALMQIQMSRPVNASVSFIPPVLRIAGYLLGDSGTPLTSPQVLDVPFPVAAGQKVLVVGRVLRADGRLSNHFQHTTSVTA